MSLRIDSHPTWVSDLDTHAITSMTSLFGRINNGSSQLITAPGWGKLDDADIMDMIETKVLAKVDLTAFLRDYENSMRALFGPRSFAEPWDVFQDNVKKYFPQEFGDYSIYDFKRYPGPQLHNLRPLSMLNAVKRVLHSRSAGLPSLRNKGQTLDMYGLEKLKNLQGVYPCILFYRTQEGNKTRVVWGYPFADALREMQFFDPFFEIERLWAHRGAVLSPDVVDMRITALIEKQMAMGGELYCVDFSGFDQSVTPELTHESFSYMARHFQKVQHRELAEIANQFLNIGLHTPGGTFYGTHGIPSGSTFTNTIDSLAQWIASGFYDTNMCQIQGDDGVYWTPDSASLASSFEDRGLKVNAEKSGTYREPKALYLRRLYEPHYRSRNNPNMMGGVYSVYRAVMRLKYMEKWESFDEELISGPDYFSLRAIMILETCAHHPAFEVLVKLVATTVDKFNLKFNNSAVKYFENILADRTRARYHKNTNPLGTKGGIMAFHTVRILKSI